MKYQQTKATTGNSQFGQGFQRNQNGQRSGTRGVGGANVGEVISMDESSITIKLQDGSSKIINVSGSTTFSKTDIASKSGVAVGDRIAAIGMAASDGSITAQNIQLNPMFRGSGGQGVSPRPSQ